MKRRKNSPLWSEKKKNKNWNKLDRETSKPFRILTINLKQDNKKFNKEDFSSKPKRKNMHKKWNSKHNFTAKNWKRFYNPVLYNKRRESKIITNVKRKLNNVRNRFRSNKDYKLSKRSEPKIGNNNSASMSAKTTNIKCRHTSINWWKNLNKNRITLHGCKNSDNIKCSKSKMKISWNGLTRNKMYKESWKCNSTRRKN